MKAKLKTRKEELKSSSKVHEHLLAMGPVLSWTTCVDLGNSLGNALILHSLFVLDDV